MLLRSCSIAVVLAISPILAQRAEGFFYFGIDTWVQANGTSWTEGDELGVPIGGLPMGASTITFTSSNGIYSLTTTPRSPVTAGRDTTYTSRNDLIDSLSTSWTLTLDAGLPTQHIYTTTLDLGTLPNVVAPTLFSLNSRITTTPTFNFLLSDDTGPTYNLTLNHFPPHGGQGVRDYRIAIPSSTSSWSPPAPLLPDTTYLLDIDARLSNGPSGMAFSPPIDANGNTLSTSDYRIDLGLEYELTAIYTTLPEPSMAGAIACFGVMFSCALRRRKA